MDFDLSTYYPVFLYLLAILGFCVGVMVLTHLPLIKPFKRTRVKLMPYESGMDPIGDARQRFDVRYYLVAIAFLLFDVKLLYLYPWAVAQWSAEVPEGAPAGAAAAPGIPPELRHLVFGEILVFIAVLAAAFAYAWRKGVFEWR